MRVSIHSATSVLSQAVETLTKDSSKDALNVLEATLIASRLVRAESEKKCHFWNFSLKANHRKFDRVYAEGLKLLLSKKASELPLNAVKKLAQQAVPKDSIAEDVKNTTKIGMGACAGLAIGDIYSQTLTNLIIHEHGHAWAMEQVMGEPDTITSTNAEHWLKQGEWAKWWHAEREGAPGNWTMAQPHSHDAAAHESTDAANQLKGNEKTLIVDAAGLGAELLGNTSVAALGLLAIRQKKPVLGSMLLCCAATSHISAHSYIRRTPELLTTWSENKGGDPPQIAKDLAEVFGCEPTVAFEFLYYGYLAAPLVILGALALFFAKSPQEPIREAALKRVITNNPDSPQLKRILADMEIEAKVELACATGKEKEKVTKKMVAKLIDRIRKDSATAPLLKKAEEEIKKELKGNLHPVNPLVFRVRLCASISGIASMTLRRLGETLLPALNQATQVFTGVFIGGQVVCLVLDAIQTWGDLKNAKLNTTAKVISVVRLFLSVVGCAAAIAALFFPGINGIVIGIIVISIATRLILTGIDLRNRKMLMRKEEEKKI